MLLATLAIIILMILMLSNLEFWPSVLSWILMPFAVVHGMWWSKGLQIFPFSAEIADAQAYSMLWDATILAVAFFGTAAVWLSYKSLFTNETQIATPGDRLGELLMASRHSFEGKR